MTLARWANMAKSVTWRYAAMGAAFGLLFPLSAAAMLLASGAVSSHATVAGLLAAIHGHSPLMYMIDSAPIFLGLFAGFAGVRQAKLVALNASLADRVASQTASLREALQRAEKTNVLISQMADHDPLTGLLNRRRMHKELATAVSHAHRYGTPFALVFIDLNGFKAINDDHGHDAGDRFLSGFAALLEETVRDTDLIGRWGGDEFVVLLPQATQSAAQRFTERLRERLGRQSIDIGRVEVAASASIGIAIWPDHGNDPEALLVHADRNMYRAKRERDGAAHSCEAA